MAVQRRHWPYLAVVGALVCLVLAGCSGTSGSGPSGGGGSGGTSGGSPAACADHGSRVVLIPHIPEGTDQDVADRVGTIVAKVVLCRSDTGTYLRNDSSLVVAVTGLPGLGPVRYSRQNYLKLQLFGQITPTAAGSVPLVPPGVNVSVSSTNVSQVLIQPDARGQAAWDVLVAGEDALRQRIEKLTKQSTEKVEDEVARALAGQTGVVLVKCARDGYEAGTALAEAAEQGDPVVQLSKAWQAAQSGISCYQAMDQLASEQTREAQQQRRLAVSVLTTDALVTQVRSPRLDEESLSSAMKLVRAIEEMHPRL